MRFARMSLIAALVAAGMVGSSAPASATPFPLDTVPIVAPTSRIDVAVITTVTPATEAQPIAMHADTIPIAPAPIPAPGSLADLIGGAQMTLVTVLASLLTWILSHAWPGFTNLGDWGKRGILLLSAYGITMIVHLVHGNVTADLATLVQTTLQAIVAAFASGTIFKLGTTKPAS